MRPECVSCDHLDQISLSRSANNHVRHLSPRKPNDVVFSWVYRCVRCQCLCVCVRVLSRMNAIIMWWSVFISWALRILKMHFIHNETSRSEDENNVATRVPDHLLNLIWVKLGTYLGRIWVRSDLNLLWSDPSGWMLTLKSHWSM